MKFNSFLQLLFFLAYYININSQVPYIGKSIKKIEIKTPNSNEYRGFPVSASDYISISKDFKSIKLTSSGTPVLFRAMLGKTKEGAEKRVMSTPGVNASGYDRDVFFDTLTFTGKDSKKLVITEKGSYTDSNMGTYRAGMQMSTNFDSFPGNLSFYYLDGVSQSLEIELEQDFKRYYVKVYFENQERPFFPNTNLDNFQNYLNENISKEDFSMNNYIEYLYNNSDKIEFSLKKRNIISSDNNRSFSYQTEKAAKEFIGDVFFKKKNDWDERVQINVSVNLPKKYFSIKSEDGWAVKEYNIISVKKEDDGKRKEIKLLITDIDNKFWTTSKPLEVRIRNNTYGSSNKFQIRIGDFCSLENVIQHSFVK